MFRSNTLVQIYIANETGSKDRILRHNHAPSHINIPDILNHANMHTNTWIFFDKSKFLIVIHVYLKIVLKTVAVKRSNAIKRNHKEQLIQIIFTNYYPKSLIQLNPYYIELF